MNEMRRLFNILKEAEDAEVVRDRVHGVRAKARLDSILKIAEDDPIVALQHAKQYASWVATWPEDTTERRTIKQDILQRVRGVIQFLEG